jgi:hypothetical protein
MKKLNATYSLIEIFANYLFSINKCHHVQEKTAHFGSWTQLPK